MPLINDRDKEFFAPLWRRVTLLVLLVVWMAWEFWSGEEMWATIVAGIAALVVWVFFITFKPPEPKAPAPAAEPDPDDEDERP